MIHNGKLKVIDFQDARMGPCQYDLVSLLKDSYVVLNESVRSELLEYYIECMEENGREVIREPFYKIFEWMSLQRNLKAIGTFAYQHKVLGNDRYLQYIEPTLDYLRQTLGNRRDLEFLSPALNSVIPTLNAN
jgi:aminoglycoside/choline kinase family phosphotransferase